MVLAPFSMATSLRKHRERFSDATLMPRQLMYQRAEFMLSIVMVWSEVEFVKAFTIDFGTNWTHSKRTYATAGNPQAECSARG